MNKTLTTLIPAMLTLSLLSSCGKEHMPVFEITNMDGASAMTSAAPSFNRVKQIFAAKCTMCHNGSTHPKDWTIYETAKANLAQLNNRLFVVGNMPAVGSLSGEEKTLIKAWILAGGPLEGLSGPNDPTPTPEPTPTPAPTPTLPPTPVPAPEPLPTPDTNKSPGFDQVKPIFLAKCSMCHNGSYHPKNWTIYETAKKDLVKLNDRLFVVGNMPASGSLSVNEKKIIKAWIAAGGPLKGAAPAPAPGPMPMPTPAPRPAPRPAPLPLPIPGQKVVGFDQIKPIFATKCTMCHNGSVHPKNWTLYETAKKDLVKLNERLLVIGNMPASGSLSVVEKKLIKAWIAAGGPLKSSGSAPAPIPSPTPSPSPVPNPIPNQTPMEAGKLIVLNKCLACHGAGAAGMDTPLLHGQEKKYLIKQLQDFKSDFRKDLIMGAMKSVASTLSSTDMENVALYLSSQAACSIPIEVNPKGGNAEAGKTKVNSCSACHTAIAPSLSGQKTSYLKINLLNFKKELRKNEMMNPMAQGLSEEDISDIAAYFNSLRNCK